ncbi:hypothetical protein AWZ03_014728, partial [Drosophila navojoa]
PCHSRQLAILTPKPLTPQLPVPLCRYDVDVATATQNKEAAIMTKGN